MILSHHLEFQVLLSRHVAAMGNSGKTAIDMLPDPSTPDILLPLIGVVMRIDGSSSDILVGSVQAQRFLPLVSTFHITYSLRRLKSCFAVDNQGIDG